MRGLLVAALVAAAAIGAAAADARPSASAAAAPAPAAGAGLVDPRAGGLAVGLGEWSVAPEANAIRPGTVTFVVKNSGKVVHGLRVKEESDRSGGDRFKERTLELRPGQRQGPTSPASPSSRERSASRSARRSGGRTATRRRTRSPPRAAASRRSSSARVASTRGASAGRGRSPTSAP